MAPVFLNRWLHDRLEPLRVPDENYYCAGKDANYCVNIDDVAIV